MAGIVIGSGTGSSSELAVDTSGRASVKLPTHATPANAGSVRIVSENDPGDVTGTAYLQSPETTDDFRLRVGVDTLLDSETFSYTAQNTAKHIYRNTTLTNAWASGFMTTNSGSATTTTTGTLFQTYRSFPLFGASALYAEFNAAFSLTSGPTNVIIDFGFFQNNTSTPYAPTDGVGFRLTSSGFLGVVNYNGSETTTALALTITANRVYHFTVSLSEREVEFWVDDVLYGTIDTVSSTGQPLMAFSAPLSVRHAHTGLASAAIQFKLADYTVSLSEWHSSRDWETTMAGMGLMGYQGTSGGTMGSTANYANSANPTAAVPTNTTAALGSGLGGQFWETDTVAVTTDCILSSYQVPAATIAAGGRNLIIRGVTVDSYIQTALTGGGYVAQYSLAFGHTAVSLATSEAATTKAPRRVALGVQTVASGAAALTLLAQVTRRFDCPIVVQPGEFVQVVKKKVGTAPSAGVVAHVITFDAVWE